VASRLDHITLVSSTQRAYFEQALPADRISVILHGIDTTFFHPVAKPDGATLRCITVGSYLRDWSLLQGVAGALGDDASICFDVVSSSVPGFDQHSVAVHRHVSDESLRDLYQRADIVLLPLADATANNALLEGMASGLPVIATDLPSMREYAGDDTGILVAHDVEAFVEAIRTLKGDTELRKRLGHSARERAEGLSWEHVAPKYAELYGTVASAR
jgi:glycosyltransferase involved in cell wall biosynthesis